MNKRKAKLTNNWSPGPPAISAAEPATWSAACYQEVMAGLDVSPPLPVGWSEEKREGEATQFVHEKSGHTTSLDPRFLPKSWTMGFNSRGDVIFCQPNGPPTQIDPRGLPEHWRMEVGPSAQPFWSNDELCFTTFVDPRGLPPNSELRASGSATPQKVYFVDHQTKHTSWKDPRTLVDLSKRRMWYACNPPLGPPPPSSLHPLPATAIRHDSSALEPCASDNRAAAPHAAGYSGTSWLIFSGRPRLGRPRRGPRAAARLRRGASTYPRRC